VFTNWLTYRIVAEQLHRRLRGWTTGDLYSQDKNELIIDLHRGDESRALHISAHSHSAYIVLRDDFKRAKKNTVALLNGASGNTIASIDIAASDRIIRILFAGGSALLITMYATKANVFYIDEHGESILSFKKTDSLPDVAALEFDDAIDVPDSPEIEEALRRNASLKSLRPWLAGTLEQEILRRAAQVENASTGIPEPLTSSIAAALDECCEPPWYVYSRHGIPQCFSLVRIETAWDDEKQFSDIFEALFYFVKERDRTKRLASLKMNILRAIEREIGHAKRALAKAAPESTLTEQAALYEKYGNLLMMNLERQPTQPGSITLPDAFTDMRLVVTIPLDRKYSLLENAQRYFEKARNTRASIEYVAERKTQMQRKLERMVRTRLHFSPIDNYHTLRDTMAEQHDLMDELGLTGKGEKARVFPFRRFIVAGGFEVWAGKNSENNDLLTVKNSKPNDIWFHARGVGGSHVVIKVDSAPGKPNKDTIREAAAIAAYYSKYRNAKSVPVAYTEKKYVRKPKGVPAGTVTLEREKVIMVQPGLPQGAEEE